MKASRAFYDDPEFDYENYWQGREYEHEAEKLVLNSFFARIAGGNKKLSQSRLLDVGAGFGRLAEVYLPLVKEAMLLEPSGKIIKRGKQRLRYSNFIYKQGFIEGLARPKKLFDIAVMVRVMHHLDDYRLALENVYQSLVPGGWLILEVPNKFSFKHVVADLIRGRWRYFNHDRVDRRSMARRKEEVISFYNYSPREVKRAGEKQGFRVIEKRSVSNFRWSLLKKIIPLKALIYMEKHTQSMFSFFNFGPSIFFLLKKDG